MTSPPYNIQEPFNNTKEQLKLLRNASNYHQAREPRHIRRKWDDMRKGRRGFGLGNWALIYPTQVLSGTSQNSAVKEVRAYANDSEWREPAVAGHRRPVNGVFVSEFINLEVKLDLPLNIQ